MKNVKEQKGITLIALIITIIVMLILVGVTINVALNGGLFDKAKTAAEGTQKQADIETLQSLAIATYDEKTNEVDFTKLTEEALKLGFTGSEGTYSKNNVTYKVNKQSAKVEENDGEQKQETISPAGTYNNASTLLGDSNIDFQKLELREDGTGTVNTNVALTWEYSEETSVISFTVPQNNMNITGKFRMIGTNKIITATNTRGKTEVITTNAFEGLIPLSGYVYESESEDLERKYT